MTGLTFATDRRAVVKTNAATTASKFAEVWTPSSVAATVTQLASEDEAWDAVLVRHSAKLDAFVATLMARAASGETRPLNLDDF